MLDDLERLARAATPGPWRVTPRCGFGVETVVGGKRPLIKTVVMAVGAKQEYPSKPDSAFIAACSPERILALIEVVRALEQIVAVKPSPDCQGDLDIYMSLAGQKTTIARKALDALMTEEPT